jgi:L,D-peptidoglycan transpeptidase YkuD (ErfK/YbiS/YcfS/YnhG family)
MDRAVVGPDQRLRFHRHVFRAALGRAGITTRKQEGDGATPAGLLPIRRILYRADRVARPRSPLAAEPIAPDDGWCDDPQHRDYNRQIRLPHEAHHEELWRSDPLYDVIGVLGWNDRPVQAGLGSAIFIHVARPDHAPTEGCLALALADLLILLADGAREIEVRAA